MRRVLITGGAGFIGSHVADELLAAGYSVRALDALTPQVHESLQGPPDYLDPEVELVVGDVRDPDAVRRALSGVDAVIHLAAVVGVGQSMYEVHRYVDVNDTGTAVLLQALIERPVGRLVVASSMSIYGEGLYVDADGHRVEDATRSLERLRAHEWEPRDAAGRPLSPVATPETKRPALSSVYALSKYDQERLCLILGDAYGIPAVALRFFNVYGPRQALSNPYTGVLAIFASRLLNGMPPLLFEDGAQRRDFVHVRDVARACRLALETPGAAGRALNIGSGESHTVREIAERLAALLRRDEIEPRSLGKCRVGDVRHCFADIGEARRRLGYEPRVRLEEGMEELAAWLEGRLAADRIEQMGAELAARGLTV